MGIILHKGSARLLNMLKLKKSTISNNNKPAHIDHSQKDHTINTMKDKRVQSLTRHMRLSTIRSDAQKMALSAVLSSSVLNGNL